jgi:Flp pilus assembly protein TadD
MQSPSLIRFYHGYLQHQDTARFIRSVAWRYDNSTLAALARRGACTERRAAVLALGYLGDYSANQVMAGALRDADRGVRLAAESGIRNVWLAAGTVGQRQQILLAERYVNADQFQEAVVVTRRVAQQTPEFAEAWRIQGIAHFGLGRIREARRDFERALRGNPFQYQAAIGLGNCLMRAMDPTAALRQFQLALHINPNLDLIRVHVARLSKALEQS